jgi:hypothetical protein
MTQTKSIDLFGVLVFYYKKVKISNENLLVSSANLTHPGITPKTPLPALICKRS